MKLPKLISSLIFEIQQKEDFAANYVDSDEFHLTRIGKLIEDIETQMRMTLDSIYMMKTREVCFGFFLFDLINFYIFIKKFGKFLNFDK